MSGDASRPPPDAPLADRLRPRRAEEVVGQDAVLGEGTLLGLAFETGRVPSLVLWGPPGSGKTTLARLLADHAGATFEALSAVTSGVKDVRAVIARARERREEGVATLLFVDEIHRFNRAQQDAFLPHVEDGTITLVGATTENPGFSLVGALLSRLRVVALEPLDDAALGRVLDRALEDAEHGLPDPLPVADGGREALIATAGGDARRLLNALESAMALAREGGADAVEASHVEEAAQRRLPAYDRTGDDRYDMLSAFHKSLRGSDADAALWWMVRMIDAGEDPLVVCRRMIAMASEDVGAADPEALRIALDAREAVGVLGLPEGALAMTQACLHLATAPKSNTVVRALAAVRRAQREHPDLPVPLAVRNAPTRLARDLGHGKGYRYPHDFPHGVVAQRYRPEPVDGLVFFEPEAIGRERETARRLAWWREQQARARREDPPPKPPARS